MLVRMKVRIGGFRNLEPWPAPGDTIDVPDHEARDLIAARYAEEVPDARSFTRGTLEPAASRGVDAGNKPADPDSGGEAPASDSDETDPTEPVTDTVGITRAPSRPKPRRR